MELNLNDSDYYLTPVSDANERTIPKISKENGTIRRVINSLVVKNRIGGDKTKFVLSDIQSQSQSAKKVALDKALGIYRVAKESGNPFQAIDTYFSCIHTIVRENIGISELASSDLENALKCVVGDERDFKKSFDKYWGRYRSGGTYGLFDLMNKSLVEDAKKDSSHVEQWTRKLIVDYINRNKEER